MGVAHLWAYLTEKNRNYMQLVDGVLLKYTPFKKQIKLAEVTSIKKVGKDYWLSTQHDRFRIQTNWMEQSTIPTLQEEFAKYSWHTAS